MIKATKEFLCEIEALAEAKKAAIRAAKDEMEIAGTVYYVSNDGNDANDGKTPQTAWKTLSKVTEAELEEGDGVKFRRGDLFRGMITTKPGVTYCAYGEGEKPKFYGWDKSLADPALWELYDAEHNIWKLRDLILDSGTLVFNDSELHSRKLIPSYRGGKFVCRDNEEKDFVMADEMTEDLDLFCCYVARTDTKPSKGEDFPIPVLDYESFGELYLRCDKGNPGEVFSEIEALPRRNMIRITNNANVRIDNLCIKYIGCHAIGGGGHVVGLHVTNCEIGWVGGTVQTYAGTDPNYPQGRRGSVTRFGNGIEIYGGCEDYLVKDCYIYQIYDAGMTHQITTRGKKYTLENIRYLDNLVEKCVYSIEYFLEKNNGDQESYIKNCEIAGNILRLAGYGWGQQRHNTYTPAHIKGWSYENTASEYYVHDNIFDRGAYRLVHLVAKNTESLPKMHDNTYIQKYGMTLGQYGANNVEEPPIHAFFEKTDSIIENTFGDKNAKIYYMD
ncbi:MAG: hypothetical protein E7640_01260 [Ruminococcaceae bacterium]|nr:hypothetical protein [Oscillospiraceae bacterium]